MNRQYIEKRFDEVNLILWKIMGFLISLSITAWIAISLVSWVIGKYNQHFGVN